MSIDKFVEDIIEKKLHEAKNSILSGLDSSIHELSECFDLILAKLKYLEEKINKNVKNAENGNDTEA